MRIFVSSYAHVCEQMLTIVNEDSVSAADTCVNRMTRLLTNVSNAARFGRGDVSHFSGAQHLLCFLIAALDRVLAASSTALKKYLG